MLTRNDLEKREIETLAPYAAKSAESLGREHPESEHPCRTAWQRDRDRIIHCTAFRRLEYKTQVFVNHEGDYYRTRLTHTLEVAQIAGTLGIILGLNTDLVEAIALGHDMGHTPFGHCGEGILDNLLKGIGGFEHNAQGLRIVEQLEDRYPDFKGLNLTVEVREGILKGNPPYPGRDGRIDPRQSPSPPLEAQVVNVSDEIAYNSHDVDDGIKSGLMRLEDLEQVEIGREVFSRIENEYGRLSPSILRHQVVRKLIDLQVTDVGQSTEKNTRENDISTLNDVRNHSKPLVRFSTDMERKNRELKDFLMDRLYNHYQVIRMADKAQRMLGDLFKVFSTRTEQLPPECQSRIQAEPAGRVIADYIAGMTDRFAAEEYRKLFLPLIQV